MIGRRIASEKLLGYFHIFLMVLLGILLAQYGYYIINDACLTFGDEGALFFGFLNQKKIPICYGGVWRFSPLMMQEYCPYMPLNFDDNIKVVLMGVHNFVKLAMLLVCICSGVRVLSNKISGTLACLFIPMSTPALFWSYSLLQSAESSVITLWAAWFYCFISAQKNDSSGFYVFAIIFAVLAFYMKETAFILIFPISVISLAINFDNLVKKEKIYHLMIILQLILFFVLYCYCAQRGVPYNIARCREAVSTITLFYIGQHPIVKISCIIALIRFTYFVSKRKNDVRIVDALLLSSLLFIGAHIVLRLKAHYYIMPAIVVQQTVVIVYLYMFWKSELLKKMTIRAFWLTKIILIGGVVSAFFYVFGEARNRYTEMLGRTSERLETNVLINKAAILKSTGYTVVAYTPNIECFVDNPFRWHQNMWMLSVYKDFIAQSALLLCNELPVHKDFKFVSDVSQSYNLSDEKYFLVFTNPKALIAQLKIDNKIAILVPNIGTDYVNHLSVLDLPRHEIPHFYVYMPTAIDCWLDFPQNGIIDITNPPFNVYVAGLSQSEEWGRWSDGKQVRINIKLPPYLRGRELSLEIPLIHVLNNKQRVLLTLNRSPLREIVLSEPRTIFATVNKSISSTGTLELLLDLPDAVAPRDIFPGNLESRMLAIGFKEIIVKETEPSKIGKNTDTSTIK
ncbi:MAG: glycosyltransferase family 39 protein [Holosporaceae bacterium]|jgi:4-amino-4-deoxy-L-arabinose transferase-like glycosyltransferase|nr:glycosyltransferase family 39 protein [Holosporaceae bacterium]